MAAGLEQGVARSLPHDSVIGHSGLEFWASILLALSEYRLRCFGTSCAQCGRYVWPPDLFH